MLFSNDNELKMAAEEELIKYVDKVMSASYGIEVSRRHRCCKDDESTLRGRNSQLIRDCRHSEHCVEIEGKVIECSECLRLFSSKDVVNLALSRWKQWGSEWSDSTFKECNLLDKERLDTYS